MNESFKDSVLSFPLTDDVFDRVATIEHRPGLRMNKHLTKHQWNTLWEPNLPAAEAASMLDRVLDAEQIDTVLSSEKRGTVLIALFRRDMCTEAQQRVAITNAKGSTFPAMVMQTSTLHPNLLSLAAERLEGVEKLEWCAAYAGLHTEDELFDVLTSAVSDVSIREMKSFNRLVGKIITASPGLIERIFALDPFPSALKTVLAGSRFTDRLEWQERIFAAGEDDEFAGLALSANPVAYESVLRTLCDHSAQRVRAAAAKRFDTTFRRVAEAFETVSDADDLNWLLRRALPNQYRPDGRITDLVALALNPNIDLITVEKIDDALDGVPPGAVPATTLNTARAVLADRLSRPAPEPSVESGFWTARSHPYRTEPMHWILDPAARPWDGIDTEVLLAEHSHLANVGSVEMYRAVYLEPKLLHLYLVHELGNHPHRWEMLLSLAKTHHGKLSKLIMATKRLTR